MDGWQLPPLAEVPQDPPPRDDWQPAANVNAEAIVRQATARFVKIDMCIPLQLSNDLLP